MSSWIAIRYWTARLRPRCQSPALIIAQTEPSPAQLLTKHAVLLAKVIDDLHLVFIHPAADRDQQEPERIQRLQHRITYYRGPGLTAANRGRFNRIQFPDRTALDGE